MRRRRLVVAGRDRAIFDILKMIAHDRIGARVARKAGVAPGTIYNMRREPKQGGTMYPRHLTLAKIGAAYGYDMKFVDRSGVVYDGESTGRA